VRLAFGRVLPLLLLSLCASCAQAEPPRPLLWKVSDANNSLYLLGSFHLLKPGDYPMAALADPGFADCYEPVGDFPEVGTDLKWIYTRILT